MSQRPLAERLERRLIAEGDCMVFTGAKDRDGYGVIGLAGKQLRAHRAAFQIENGPIPDGLVIDHLCRNRACCNPAHLEAVTCAENIRRGMTGKENNYMASRTHCKRGHEFTPENTYTYPSINKRVCRTCAKGWTSRG